jgi:cell division protein FtsI (penicillin-binding protein 3)
MGRGRWAELRRLLIPLPTHFMSHPLHARRLRLIATTLLVVFVGLMGRLVYLQSVREDELTRIARNNTRREVFLEPRRGQILDARGELLAASQIVKTICADPSLIGNQMAPVARALSPLLGMDAAELHRRLTPGVRRETNLVPIAAGSTVFTNCVTETPVQYVVLKSKVPVETWQRIEQTMTNLNFGYDEQTLTRAQRRFLSRIRYSAIFPDVQDDQIRIYPQGRLAAHVLGYTAVTNGLFSGKSVRELLGQEGIERQFDKDLAGQRGWRVIEVDKARRELVDKRIQDVAPVDGLDVVLTLDSFIQHELEDALADAMRKHTPISAAGVVLRPRTGDILAMAVLPDYDPNFPGAKGTTPADRRNRLIADRHEPGSTFKVAVISGALDAKVVRLSDSFFCENGTWFYAGRTLRDHDGYGTLTGEGIVTKSSNIGAAKIALRLGNTNLWQYLVNFGFGTRTGIELPGESRGRVWPTTSWTPLSITRIAMGHEVDTTPLQMVMAISAIANQGTLMRPRLVQRFQDRAGRTVIATEPREIRRVISPAAAADMVKALKTVPTKQGTAEGAALERFTVAGKTGTAQKAGPNNTGYLPGKYFSSFIGFFPADNPELCIAIFLDEPKEGYYGGKVAAPVFRQVAERVASYLNIPPDRPAPDAAKDTNGTRAPRSPREPGPGLDRSDEPLRISRGEPGVTQFNAARN